MNILKERWQPINQKLNNHIRLYDNLTLNMQDELQSVFDSIKIPFLDLNKPISQQQKNKLNRLYQQWQEEGIMTTYFSQKAQRILKKINISYLEMISLMIEAIYLRRMKKLDDERLLKEIAKETYEREIKKENGKLKAIDVYILSLLALPNVNGYIWNEYKQATTEYYANQMTNQVAINMQQQKELDINRPEFQKILNTEQKRYLNKKKEPVIDKYSGSLDTEVAYIVNNFVLRALIDLGYSKVQLVAVIDKNTSKMCESLNAQTFKIKGINRFNRYSQNADGYIDYKIEGLVSGINLPPINDGFHYCRSTIVGIR